MSFFETIQQLDIDLFLFLNGKHSEFFDFFMTWATHRWIWIPLYILVFYFVLKKTGKRSWMVLLAVALSIFLTDRFSVYLKNGLKRERPCHNEVLVNKIHLVDGCGGKYGFISSHAANTFALALFLSLFFANGKKILPIVFFGWACLVSYSRIYLGAHYPADIFAGAMLGLLSGWIGHRVYLYLDRKTINPFA